jgi:hypothetical protein
MVKANCSIFDVKLSEHLCCNYSISVATWHGQDALHGPNIVFLSTTYCILLLNCLYTLSEHTVYTDVRIIVLEQETHLNSCEITSWTYVW